MRVPVLSPVPSPRWRGSGLVTVVRAAAEGPYTPLAEQCRRGSKRYPSHAMWRR